MLADSLLACHSASVSAQHPLSLKVFVSGRGRLEDEGAISLADAFKVFVSCGFSFFLANPFVYLSVIYVIV